MNGALKWSNAYNNKTYNNKKGLLKQRRLYYCMTLLFLLSNVVECSVLTQSFISFFFLKRPYSVATFRPLTSMFPLYELMLQQLRCMPYMRLV